MCIAHPTHGAGKRPNRTQLKTAARKTTLNAGQCVRQPREGRGRNRQAPPPQKKKEGGGGKGAKTAHSRQTARHHHQRRPNPPLQKAPKTGPPKRHRGTTHPKPATPSQEQRPTGKRYTETKKKKKRATSPARKKGDGGTGTTKPGTGKKKQKRKKHTPTTQPRRAGHSRDPGPAHTPTPHAGTENSGGQAGRPRNHTRPISRPKPKPNHEHQKKQTLEGRHHKPCPNTPTKDPSQDWRG